MNVLGKVTWELVSGVRALRTLSDLLSEVGRTVAAPAELCGDRDQVGVLLDGRNYWFGINYNWPEMLQFSTEQRQVDPEAAALLGLDGVFAWKDRRGHGWHRCLRLECEDVHFFARTRASQVQLLTNFARECMDTVSRIEIRSEDESAAAGAVSVLSPPSN